MVEDLRNNENRARFKNDSVNPMTPRSADGPVATGSFGGVKGNEMPPGILNSNSTPWTLDPHQNQRHSNNLANPSPERPRTQRTEETRRRIFSRGPGYRY
jgi:hypothetical protein